MANNARCMRPVNGTVRLPKKFIKLSKSVMKNKMVSLGLRPNITVFSEIKPIIRTAGTVSPTVETKAP